MIPGGTRPGGTRGAARTGNTPFPDPPQGDPAGITSAELEADRQGYAAALDHCQSEIKRLRHAWEKAKHRQAANEALALKLTTSITATTKPDDATRITTQANTASGQAHDAGIEADHYALRAHTALTALTALTDFTQHASTYQSTLEGSSPGEAPGPLGALFTAPRAPGTPEDNPAARAPARPTGTILR